MSLPLDFDTRLITVGGRWRLPAGGGTLELADPSSGQALAAIGRGGPEDVDDAVAAAEAALAGPWGRLTASERGQVLEAVGRAVAAEAESLARLEAMDVGKPLAQARTDALALARYCAFYGAAADKVTGQTIPTVAGGLALTLREPHGVTGHIVPWNYPMQIVGRTVGAALAMGNACVVKPAEQACLTVLAFARLAEAAGLPAGALNVVTGLGEEAGAALAAHPGVRHLSFTGSLAVGRLVQAAAARHVAPVTLELGGKSPAIVFADADLDAALPAIVRAGVQNAGQTCSAASRVLVQRPLYEAVRDGLAARYRALRVAPALEDGDVGPIVSAEQRQAVLAALARGEADGARVVARARLPPHLPAGGYWVAPTLLDGLAPGHALAQQEIFGPVQVLLPFDDEDDAVALANGTAYGLVAGVFTRELGRALRVARRLQAGQVFVNQYGAGGGVELPFGGVKASGHGREKGFEALYGFSTLKAVAIQHG